MQSTGHSSMHALSLTSMHGPAITYGMSLSSLRRDLHTRPCQHADEGECADLAPQAVTGTGALSVEWPGNSCASGSSSTAALLTAVATSPKPTLISRTLPS